VDSPPIAEQAAATRDPATLVLADDHPLYLEGLYHLFSHRDDLSVLARCSSGREVIAAVRHLNPDVLVLDLHMPDLDGIDVVRELREEGLETRVVVLASSLDEEEALECMKLRVAGVVLKEMAPESVLRCVRKVAAGDVWIEKQSFSRAIELLLTRQETFQSLASRLSGREFEIMTLCAQGLSNAEIADRLYLSEGTVKTHLHHVYQKLGFSGRAQVERYARERHLI
jgi:DNA-binding NarL/FixJ family response regulator